VDIPRRLCKEVEELEAEHRWPEDKLEREKRLKEIRVAAEQENECYLQEIVRGRRGENVRRVGIDNVSSEDARDENYLTEDDIPPFEITESGEVYCSRDGKPVTTVHQTHAEVVYWEFHDEGYNPRGLIHDGEKQGYYMPEPPHELVFSRDRFYFQRWAWAVGWETSDPYFWSAPERLDAP
jgi:hypothetical protein